MKDEMKEILELIGNNYYYGNISEIQKNKYCDYITNLEECYCNRTDCSARIKDSKKYNSVYQEKEDYKSRNEKAIEKIKKIQENAIKYSADHDASICQDLLNILQGEENDN